MREQAADEPGARDATDSGAESTPPDEYVVLCDEDGRPLGAAEKWSIHTADTPLHLAFSCYLFDSRGRFLATRRAPGKKVWPGVWSNSACGHPAPGEAIEAAVRRRLAYELGLTAGPLVPVLPRHRYRAPPFHGIVENEFCPVWAGRALGEPRPNPEEVAEYRWISWTAFVDDAQRDRADRYSWWCKNQLRELAGHPAIEELARASA